MKKILYSITLLCFIYNSASGQAAYLADPDNFAPNKSTKIIVNLNATKNDNKIIEAAAAGEDMYLWTWSPKELPAVDSNANGIADPFWKNSNPKLKMTKEGDGIYSFTMIPTEFYKVTSQEVYDKDFQFLIKPRDGGGFGDPDVKTEDLKIEVDPPVSIKKIESFPSGIGKNADTLTFADGDPFSIIYNHSVESKPTLLTATDFYIFPKAKGSDGLEYKVSGGPSSVGNYPQLQMAKDANDIFTITIIPERLFNIPTGVKIVDMTFKIVKPNLVSSDDSVAEELKYIYKDQSCD